MSKPTMYLIEARERDETIGVYVSSGSVWHDMDAPITHTYVSDKPAGGPNIITCKAIAPSDWRHGTWYAQFQPDEPAT